ncbi:FkbM family methyltransferase [Pseudomonas sp. Irchel s3h9]|uniref:FkbM family methyltransferase n=1 Tax=Pseudomonas sp. Irchel s3h9 TaxID=2009192 RepID=UPI000BA414DC|nr:FkbM family methyltransferase [Pseudomonas sp. Irchel s3h9]
MKFVSYAQNLEDLMLWRAFSEVERGFYIDVGANDPTVDSVTRAFYDRGWRGINIEPLKEHFDDLVLARPLDINLCVAAGNEVSEIELWDFGVRGWGTAAKDVINTLSSAGREGVSYKVEVTTLSLICEQYVAQEIHFLKVDVEGLEKAVLEGMDFKKFRPWVVVVEATRPNSKEESYLEWEQILTSQDYVFVYADGLNRFYLAAEKTSLAVFFKYPPNVFDEFVFYSEVQARDELRAAEERLQIVIADADAELHLAHENANRVQAAYDQIVSSRAWRFASMLGRISSIFRRRS